MTVIDFPALAASAASGNEIAVFEALLATVPNKTEKSTRSTVATRMEAQRQAIEDFDLDQLLALRDKMNNIIDKMSTNIGSGELRESAALNDQQAEELMSEFLDEREVDEFIKVRRDMIRDEVFAHLDEVADVPGQNGALEVKALGKKFCREGAGTGVPQVDEQRLQALLGDRWLEACDEVIIPAEIIPERIEYQLSVEKVLDLAQNDHAVLEALRTCLVPGKAKTPRFVVRDL
ncbi:hypothetical protein [Mycolicibacter kumamotonensis]|uniref:Uncharacterized protein n=1 Tax=Mycolicibacter kumamotonensis TaxID=354243 RepID=A0A1B8SLE0_9MYCO|nr:hypothetical protein [Mycolicibacter kumamotonensis]OBY33503.1 hypothetical protein ACT18_00740 [Mycolicibacter kumamotonensis]